VSAPTIAAVMNTLNEEERLPFSLGSVRPWVDEIVVVDMHSDDATAAVAQSFGARVALHDRMGYADPARSFALEQAGSDWILILDADEMVPAALARRLVRVATTNEADVVRIPMVNHLLGAPLRATGWGPDQDRHLRFFRRGMVTATSDIHDYLRATAGARILDLPASPDQSLIHFNYVDVVHFVEKLNRYTSIEAAAAAARGERSSRIRAIVAASREFLRRYFKARGYRDGWRGFYLSILMAGYRLVMAAKLAELHSTGGRTAVTATYRRIADDVLDGYASFDREVDPARPPGTTSVTREDRSRGPIGPRGSSRPGSSGR
jgi:glycosyltransferase involved in cell wall biosynthesis